MKALDDVIKIAGQMREACRKGYTLEQAVTAYRGMRLKKEELEAALKELNEIVDETKREIIPTRFKEADTTSITVAGNRFTITENVYASIPPDKKPEAYKWLRDNELSALITETVNAQTLSAQARSLLEEGKELDPDFFKVSIMNNISITKATKGSKDD